jgi:NADH:ubiquinone oxidoreductase subunit K
MLIVAYLICFGDFITSETLLEDAGKARPDEKIDYNLNRSNLIVGIRNMILAFIAPYAPLNGPIWVGGTVATCERYKQGPTEMNSIFGGMSAYIFFMAIIALLAPVVELFKPALPIAMSITMMVTGWACGYIALNMCKTREEQGIALVMAIAIAFQSAAIGLAIGVILHLFIGNRKSS